MRPIKLKYGIYFLVFAVTILIACGGGSSTTLQVSAEKDKEGTLVIELEAPEDDPDKDLSGSSMIVVGHPDVTATADSDGKITADVPAGNLEIIVTAPNEGNDLLASGPEYGIKIDNVEVKEDQQTSLENQKMRKTGGFTGQLEIFSSNEGLEVLGADIFVPGTSISAKADAEGFFTLNGLPPGTYQLAIQKSGLSTVSLSDVVVNDGQITDLGIIRLSVSLGPEGLINITKDLNYDYQDKNYGLVTDRKVTVNLIYDADAVLMKVSDEPSFLNKDWSPVQTSIEWQFVEDGLHQLYVKYSDLNGLESSPYSDEVVVDTENPVLSDAKLVNNWSQTAGAVNFIDIASDDSGSAIAEVMVSTDPNFEGASWQTHIPRVFIDTGAENGLKEVYVKVRDFAGRESEVLSDTITKGSHTILPDIVSEDITLYASQSPYYISGTVLFKKDLEVEAGTVMQLEKLVDGTDITSAILQVDGAIQIKGTATSPVIIESTEDASIGSVRNFVTLLNQSNDDIDASYISHTVFRKLGKLRLKGGHLQSVTLDQPANLSNADYSSDNEGFIEKSSLEPLTIDGLTVIAATTGVIYLQSNGGVAEISNLDFTHSLLYHSFAVEEGSVLKIKDSSLTNLRLNDSHAMTASSGKIEISNSTFNNTRSIVSSTTMEVVLANNNINFAGDSSSGLYLFELDYSASANVTLLNNNIDISSGDLIEISGSGLSHVMNIGKNNIDCNTSCRGRISLNLGNSPDDFTLNFNQNHWAALIPVNSMDLDNCASNPAMPNSFIHCHDSSSGASTSVAISAYEESFGHSGTPSALWSDGLQGDFYINSPENPTAGRQ